MACGAAAATAALAFSGPGPATLLVASMTTDPSTAGAIWARASCTAAAGTARRTASAVSVVASGRVVTVAPVASRSACLPGVDTPKTTLWPAATQARPMLPPVGPAPMTTNPVGRHPAP